MNQTITHHESEPQKIPNILSMGAAQGLEALQGFVKPEKLGEVLHILVDAAEKSDQQALGVVNLPGGFGAVAIDPIVVKVALKRDRSEELKGKISLQALAVEVLGTLVAPAMDTGPVQRHMSTEFRKQLRPEDLANRQELFSAILGAGVEKLALISTGEEVDIYQEFVKPTLLSAILQYTMRFSEFEDADNLIHRLNATMQDALLGAAAISEIEKAMKGPKWLKEIGVNTVRSLPVVRNFIGRRYLDSKNIELAGVLQDYKEQIGNAIGVYTSRITSGLASEDNFQHILAHFSDPIKMAEFRQLAKENNFELPENDERLIRDIMEQYSISITLGGHETLAHMNTCGMALAAAYPEAVIQIRNEFIQTIDGNRFNSAQELIGYLLNMRGDFHGKLPNFGDFMQETLRLFPPVKLIGRYKPGEYVINDIALHDNLIIPISELQRRFVVDGNKLKLGRERADYAIDRGYMPFGSGPRGCPGGQYAEMIGGALLLASILLYDFTPNVPVIDSEGNVTDDSVTRNAISSALPQHTTGIINKSDLWSKLFILEH